MIGTVAVASTLAIMGAAARAAPLPTQIDTARLETCKASIVLVGIDGSIVSRAVDHATGSLGFSHVYIDPCRVDAQGHPVIVDYTVAHGVHFARPDAYAHRVRRSIELDQLTAAELWGCVRSRIGQPLRVAALVAGRETIASCVGLVVGCLPPGLRGDLDRIKVGPCISPNTLALYFGATNP